MGEASDTWRTATYPPKYFSETDLDVALEVASLTRFATLVIVDNGSILPVHAPLTLLPRDTWRDSDRPKFVGHIIRSNPLFDLMQEGGVSTTVIFQPANGYVSPSVYSEKPVSGRVVPTWNYVATHFDGMLEFAREDGLLKEILRHQTADYEGSVGGAWTLDDAPTDYIDNLASAIAGFSFEATGWKTIRKLSQNRPDERRNVAQWLDTNASPAASIGYWMRKV